MSFGDRFLHYPDLFPARRSGESWGDREVAIDFVGGPYRFAGLNAYQETVIREKFGDLCRALAEPSGLAGVATRVFRVAATDFREFDLNGWEYTFDLDFQPASVRVAGLDFMARLDWQPHLQGALWISEGSPARFPELVFTNYFRVLAAYRLLERRGVLLHSAGVVDNDQAYLFLGRSGAGKTTVSRLSLAAGRVVLSDDMNALTWRGDKPVAETVPFTGELGRTLVRSAAYPVQAICRLVKSDDTTLTPLRPAETLALLLACSPIINSDPYRLDQLTDHLESFLRALPAYQLKFSLAADFWPMLKRAITGNRSR